MEKTKALEKRDQEATKRDLAKPPESFTSSTANCLPKYPRTFDYLLPRPAVAGVGSPDRLGLRLLAGTQSMTPDSPKLAAISQALPAGLALSG